MAKSITGENPLFIFVKRVVHLMSWVWRNTSEIKKGMECTNLGVSLVRECRLVSPVL